MAAPTSTYTEDKGDTICTRLEAGESLTAIARDIGVHRSTIHDWKARFPEFKARMEQATLDGCWSLLEQGPEQIAELVREVRGAAKIEDKEERAAKIATLPSLVSAMKLSRWESYELAKRKRPDVFSEKVAVTHGGAVATNLTVSFREPGDT